jgi:hypothetical protein
MLRRPHSASLATRTIPQSYAAPHSINASGLKFFLNAKISSEWELLNFAAPLTHYHVLMLASVKKG